MLRRGPLGVYGPYLAWQRASLDTSRRVLKDHGIDVAHHYSWGSLVWGSPLWKLPVPFVFGPVGGGSISPEELLSAVNRGDRIAEFVRSVLMKATPANPLSRQALRHSTVIAANSDTSRLVRRTTGVPPIVVMPETTDSELLDRHPAGMDSRDLEVLLWVGRMLPRKGILLAIDVIAEMPKRFRLNLVGDGPERRRAEHHAAMLGVSDRVEFAGTVQRDQVIQRMRSCGALLFTSIRDTTGAQLLEAAATGSPLAGIRHQGFGDFVDPKCGVSIPLQPRVPLTRKLASGLTELLSSPDRWQAAAREARRFAEQHSIDHRLSNMVQSYRQRIADSSLATCDRGALPSIGEGT